MYTELLDRGGVVAVAVAVVGVVVCLIAAVGLYVTQIFPTDDGDTVVWTFGCGF